MSKKDELDNHGLQMNRNSDDYWLSRGSDERPDIAVEDEESESES